MMREQPMHTNPVQVVVLTQPGIIDKQSIYKNMKSGLVRHLIGSGVSQFLIGIFCIIFQGVSLGIMVNNQFYFANEQIGHGFWNGLLFSITGAFGIAGGVRRSRCQVIAFNILSIISAVFALLLISIAVPSSLVYASPNYCNDGSSYCEINALNTGAAMEAMMAILGLIEGIIAIWSSAVCCTIGACCCDCGGSCCCPNSFPQNQIPMNPFVGQHQMVIASPQQPTSTQQPQIFIPNLQPVFLPSTQQPMFAHNQQQSMFVHNQQQPMFVHNQQQPFIDLDSQQQMVHYNSQQPTSPSHAQQSNSYTPLSKAHTVEDSYIGLYTEIGNNLVFSKQSATPGDTTSTYEEIPVYDTVVKHEDYM